MRRLTRAFVAAVGLLAVAAGLQVGLAQPAAAGQLGLTIEIQGAAKVTVIEGAVEDGASRECDFRDSVDDRVVNVCPRIRSSAVFSASVWLRVEAVESETDEWRYEVWEGCDEVRRVEDRRFDCKVTSASFNSTEKTVRAHVSDATAPEMTSWTQRASYDVELASVYTFTSTQGGFECSADRGASFFGCGSGFTYTWPAPGRHLMLVRGVDVSGNTSGVVQLERYHLDTYLRSGPSGEVRSDRVEVVVDSPGATEILCAIDGSDYARCGVPGEPIVFSGLADRVHQLGMFAVREGESRDEVPLHLQWRNRLLPETTIDGATVSGRTAQVRFSSPTATRFDCRLDGPVSGEDDWVACQSPVTFEDLPDADYTFAVRATDADGDVDETPAVHTFTVTGPGPVDPGNPGNPDPVVRKASRTVSVFTVSRTRPGRAVVSVRAGAAPTGRVVVLDRGRQVAATVLRPGARGKVVVRLPRLGKGVHVLVARYLGSTTVKPSQSAARRIRLR